MNVLALARAALASLRDNAARMAGALSRNLPRPAGIEFVRFGSSPIEIAVAAPVVSDRVRSQIIAGAYERKEARSVPDLLDGDEVVVELGAGVGLISTLAMRSGRAREVHTFEADERLLPLIEATHRRNGVQNCQVYNFAVTGDPEAVARGYIDLSLRGNFRANSIHSAKPGKKQRTRVNAKSLAAIIEEHHPTVLIVDIEGAEDQLFTGVDLSGVRRVSLEIHPKHIGTEGVRRVFDTLHAAGLIYDARHASGQVPVFSRTIG